MKSQIDLLPPEKKSGASNHRHSSNQKVGTPWNLITAIQGKFGPLSWDLAASSENCKAGAGRFFDEAADSFKQNWHKLSGNLWLNPPFGCITPWAEKCWKECQQGATIFLLTPASVDAAWWTNFIHRKAVVYFLSPRIQFDGHDDPFPKPMALSRFDPAFQQTCEPGWYEPWRWRD